MSKQIVKLHHDVIRSQILLSMLSRDQGKSYQQLWNQPRFARSFFYDFRSRQRTQFKHANTMPSTGSDDLPRSTSDDSENVKPKGPSRGGSEKLRLSQLQRNDSLRSIASQFSIDSVHDAVKDKEEKWRKRHENSVKRQVRLQTLI